VRTALGQRQRKSPQGLDLQRRIHPGSIAATDQLVKASEYEPLIIALFTTERRCGLADVAKVIDSVEDVRTGGLSNGEPSILAGHLPPAWRQTSLRPSTGCAPLMPQLEAAIPQDIHLSVVMDRTTNIRLVRPATCSLR